MIHIRIVREIVSLASEDEITLQFHKLMLVVGSNDNANSCGETRLKEVSDSPPHRLLIQLSFGSLRGRRSDREKKPRH